MNPPMPAKNNLTTWISPHQRFGRSHQPGRHLMADSIAEQLHHGHRLTEIFTDRKEIDLCRSVCICGLLDALHKREIELLLMYARIAAEINSAQIFLDFV